MSDGYSRTPDYKGCSTAPSNAEFLSTVFTQERDKYRITPLLLMPTSATGSFTGLGQSAESAQQPLRDGAICLKRIIKL